MCEPNAPKLPGSARAAADPAARRQGRGLICITAAPRRLARAAVPPLAHLKAVGPRAGHSDQGKPRRAVLGADWLWGSPQGGRAAAIRAGSRAARSGRCCCCTAGVRCTATVS